MRYFLLTILLLSPLPFASVRPVWQWLWTLVIGLLFTIAMTSDLFRRQNHYGTQPRTLVVATLLWLAFAGWGYVQAWPFSTCDGHAGICSAALSVNAPATFASTSFFLAHLMLLLLTYRACREPKTIQFLIRGMAIITALYAAYGFAEFAAGGTHILWFKRTSSIGEFTSTFVNRNNFASYAALGIISACQWIFGSHQSDADRFRPLQLKIEAFLADGWYKLLLLLLTATALVLTSSRAAFLSLLVALPVFLLTLGAVTQVSSKRVLLSVLGFAAVLISIFSFSGDVLEQRLSDMDTGSNPRLEAYKDTLEMIMARPLSGAGLGTYEESFRPYRSEDVTLIFDRAHNDYLELAATAGLPAAVVFLAAIGLLVGMQVRALRMPSESGTTKPVLAASLSTAIFLALHAVVDFPLQIFAITMPATIWLGIGVAAADQVLRADNRHRQARP